MEWIEGEKISDMAAPADAAASSSSSEAEVQENLTLVQAGIAATLLQLLGTGFMHADPHLGNILKVQTKDGLRLGFLDFGMVSTVPESIRDALVCVVAHVVFARDTGAVADLFGELQFLPAHVVQDPIERAALTAALQRVFDDVLQYPVPNDQPSPETATSRTATSYDGESTTIPVLRFDKLLGGLTMLVARFELTLPPYVINIARALATLEGVARQLDPFFNALQTVYPYALRRVLHNPSQSTIVEDTVMRLMRDPVTGKFDTALIRKLIADSAVFSNTSRRQVIMEVMKSKAGRRMARKVMKETLLDRHHQSTKSKQLWRMRRRNSRKRRNTHLFEL